MDSTLFSWIIVAELVMPFVIISIFLLMALIKFKSRNRQAAKKLVMAIKQSEARDKESILKFLREKAGLSEEEAKKLGIKINNERKFFFRNLVASLLNQKVANLAQINDDLHRLLELYHSLELNKNVVELEDEPDKDEQIAALKAEIKALKHEVHITLTTLNNIFAEFSSMFGEEVPNREMSVDQIITAMESFAGKGKTTSVAQPAGAESSEPPAPEEDELEVEVDESAIEAESDANNSAEDGLSENDSEDASELAEMVNDAMADKEDEVDESIDAELDAIDSALDELELGDIKNENSDTLAEIEQAAEEEEPTWDDAFAEEEQKKHDE